MGCSRSLQAHRPAAVLSSLMHMGNGRYLDAPEQVEVGLKLQGRGAALKWDIATHSKPLQGCMVCISLSVCSHHRVFPSFT